jgi:hypothetical protein
MNRHLGMCDASCAVALTGTRFLVADDEHNQLAIYDAGGGGPATQAIGLGKLVGANTKEVDLEGAAELADRIYWISSHGRTAKGQQAEERYTFFGSQVTDLDD